MAFGVRTCKLLYIGWTNKSYQHSSGEKVIHPSTLLKTNDGASRWRPWGREELDMTGVGLHFHFSLSRVGQEMATHLVLFLFGESQVEELSGIAVYGVVQIRHN